MKKLGNHNLATGIALLVRVEGIAGFITLEQRLIYVFHVFTWFMPFLCSLCVPIVLLDYDRVFSQFCLVCIPVCSFGLFDI